MSFAYIKHRSLYVVTIRLSHNPNHDPKNKIGNECLVSNWCTDSTGAHHSFCVTGTGIEDVKNRMYLRYPTIHITRVEEASFL